MSDSFLSDSCKEGTSSLVPQELLQPSEPCIVHFPASLKICAGQSHPHIRLAQAMFQALHAFSPDFKPVPVSGTIDGETAENLRRLQKCSLMPETGELDKQTWNRLSRLYRAVFDRNYLPSQG
ncbi:MAG: peptidoglycan-binding protein [Oscillospiraceae bacterium]|nr:peptidoglycan-binding protein [Oscillospiraceae bacterium]